MSARISEETLNDLTEKLISAYRARLEAQRAYYGRDVEEDPVREQAVVDTYEAYRKAKFLHQQALTLMQAARLGDPGGDYVDVATEVLSREGLIP